MLCYFFKAPFREHLEIKNNDNRTIKTTQKRMKSKLEKISQRLEQK